MKNFNQGQNGRNQYRMGTDTLTNQNSMDNSPKSDLGSATGQGAGIMSQGVGQGRGMKSSCRRNGGSGQKTGVCNGGFPQGRGERRGRGSNF
ncbi:MAG: hypothetical protein M0O96_04715 [Desulforhopalus sp.]|nr:hypothetical protein [Desulforhopalus sp.]